MPSNVYDILDRAYDLLINYCMVLKFSKGLKKFLNTKVIERLLDTTDSAYVNPQTAAFSIVSIQDQFQKAAPLSLKLSMLSSSLEVDLFIATSYETVGEIKENILDHFMQSSKFADKHALKINEVTDLYDMGIKFKPVYCSLHEKIDFKLASLNSIGYTFTKSFKTLFADKSIRLAAGNIMDHHMLSSKFVLTTIEEKDLCRRGYDSLHSRQKRNGADGFFDELFPGHQMFSMKKLSILVEYQFKSQYEIATLPGKTGEEPKEDHLDLPNFLVGHKTTTDVAVEKSEGWIHAVSGVIPNVNVIGYKHESTLVRLYRNVMRNETRRMMTSIDMVVSEAEQLFGIERTRIFFDLLDVRLFHFGSAGAIYNFLPNMAESAVRQQVISFFDYMCDMINELRRLLLGCPDSERLQQMPEQMFMSLLQSVIVSFVKPKPKGGKGISSKGTRLIKVDSVEFERALGEGIPEDVLVRRSSGNKMSVDRFPDARPERIGASEIGKNNPIHYTFTYFPTDCRLFIYIPTEIGSYWHQLDMQRANRISQHGK